jgi:hypothetical protein
MNYRTVINVEPFPFRISYNDKVMFMGSCFAANMGEQMQKCKMPVMINPAGTVYNPVSVLNTLATIISGKATSEADLFNHDGIWLSFFHYTDFSSEDPYLLIKIINERTLHAGEFLRKSDFLFVTFGTARVYRWKKTGMIVSNCHKLPDNLFDQELLTAGQIVEKWLPLLDRLMAYNQKLKVVFTVSPVRHWKDGAHGNQVSKSVLFLAIEELLKHKSMSYYFPAYELLMDDLRDYRFYADDMLHPSSSAIEYIWEKFSEAFFDESTTTMQSDIKKVIRAVSHRFITDSIKKKKAFAENMLHLISEIENRNVKIDFSTEKGYFRNIIER